MHRRNAFAVCATLGRPAQIYVRNHATTCCAHAFIQLDGLLTRRDRGDSRDRRGRCTVGVKLAVYTKPFRAHGKPRLINHSRAVRGRNGCFTTYRATPHQSYGYRSPGPNPILRLHSAENEIKSLIELVFDQFECTCLPERCLFSCTLTNSVVHNKCTLFNIVYV